MTAQPSTPVWRALQPILGQLQYPWRFMALASLGLAVAAGAACVRLPVGTLPAGTSRAAPRQTESATPAHAYALGALAALIGLAFVVNGLGRVPSQPLQISPAEAWGVARMWDEDAANGQVGATWTGEFLPQTVSEQRWALGRPLEGAQDGPAADPVPEVTLSSVGYERWNLAFGAKAPAQVRLHQFHLPAWKAWVDGDPVSTYPSGELGLVTLDLPQGAIAAALRFGPSRAVMAAGLIVLIAALAWVVLARSHPSRTRRGGRLGLAAGSLLLLLAVVAILANQAGAGVKTWTPSPVHATAGDVAQLIGYDASPAKGERALDVTLYWFALRDMAQNYKVFVHLLGPDGQVIAQQDGDPVGGYSPTSRWKQGELIADTHRLQPGDQVPPGEYQVRAGMYEVRPGETPGFRNLSLNPATEDGRIALGTVTVK